MRTGYSSLGLSLCLISLNACHSGHSPAAAPSVLPLRSVRFYDSGVAYFERSGAVQQSSTTSLPVPASHLDDALKTLVLLSAQRQGSVQALTFDSSVSRGMARALAGLPLDANAPITYFDMLSSLKGCSVEIRTVNTRVTGQLINVLNSTEDANPGKPVVATESTPQSEPSTTEERLLKNNGKASIPEEPILLVLTDSSEVRRFRASELLSIRPTDPSVAARLTATLSALNTRGAQAQKQLQILTHNTGQITLGYIAEAPIYRTTYRLLLGPEGSSQANLLQGWALIHNDTDETWNQVRVHLVNGQPDSFLFPLAAPRYAKRGLAHPESELSSVPQLLGTTADTLWGDHYEGTPSDDNVELSSIGTTGQGSGTGTGYGSGHGRLGGSHQNKVSSSLLLEVGNLAQIATLSGVEAGALYTYTLAEPVGLKAHASALLPFIEQAISAKAITWIDSTGETARSGVQLWNSTSQTLPPGPISFFTPQGFVGEATLDRLKPGEQRFLRYGADLDVAVHIKQSHSAEEIKHITFENNSLKEHFFRNSEFVYEIRNRNSLPRSVYVTLVIDKNAKVEGADRLAFDPLSQNPLGIFEVPARQNLDRTLVIQEGLARTTRRESLQAKRLFEIASSPALSVSDKSAMGEVATLQRGLEEVQDAIPKTKKTMEEIDKDLQRLREHLRAAGEKSTVSAPFAKRILAAESKMEALQKKAATLEEDSMSRKNALQTSLEKLSKR